MCPQSDIVKGSYYLKIQCNGECSNHQGKHTVPNRKKGECRDVGLYTTWSWVRGSRYFLDLQETAKVRCPTQFRPKLLSLWQPHGLPSPTEDLLPRLQKVTWSFTVGAVLIKKMKWIKKKVLPWFGQLSSSVRGAGWASPSSLSEMWYSLAFSHTHTVHTYKHLCICTHLQTLMHMGSHKYSHSIDLYNHILTPYTLRFTRTLKHTHTALLLAQQSRLNSYFPSPITLLSV